MVRFAATGTPRRRLICLPFAGGGPATYRQWPKYLPDDVEVAAVVLPGRDPSSRQRPTDSIGELVEATREGLGELDARDPLPFALFGHSMGALIAFELAVSLESDDGPAPVSSGPERLFVSGRRPPDEPHVGDRIHDLDDEPFLDAMQRNYGGVPDVVRNEPELLALFLPALRADMGPSRPTSRSSADACAARYGSMAAPTTDILARSGCLAGSERQPSRSPSARSPATTSTSPAQRSKP
jgi:surfactin synthase thioesterase subunit